MSQPVNHSQKGFTLVELMLSMAFISIMLVAIALLVMQIATMYNRGATLRTINQTSRAVVTDFKRTFSAAEASSVNTSVVSSHGRLCTGEYSYIWSFPEDDDGATPDYINNRFRSEDGGDAARLVRITDKGGVYCQAGATQRINRAEDHPVDLLAGGDLPMGLRVRSFNVVESLPDLSTGEKLFEITMRIGTDSTDAIDTTSGTCKPPTDLDSDLEYCAVNELRFTVRTGIR